MIKRKRLDRDAWTDITKKRYVQKEMLSPVFFPEFRGIAALLCIDEVKRESRWDYPDGYVVVCGAGMRWVELLPYDRNYALTAMFAPDGRVSEWYCDLTAGYGFDPDGVAVFLDCFLDLVVRPPCAALPGGALKEDDRDELEEAYADGEITEEQYREVIRETERIKQDLFSDLTRLEEISAAFLANLSGKREGTE